MGKIAGMILMSLGPLLVGCAQEAKMDDVSKLRADVALALPPGRSVGDVTAWLDRQKIDHSGLQAARPDTGPGNIILAMMPNRNPSPDRADPNRPISIVFTFDDEGILMKAEIERATSPL